MPFLFSHSWRFHYFMYRAKWGKKQLCPMFIIMRMFQKTMFMVKISYGVLRNVMTRFGIFLDQCILHHVGLKSYYLHLSFWLFQHFKAAVGNLGEKSWREWFSVKFCSHSNPPVKSQLHFTGDKHSDNLKNIKIISVELCVGSGQTRNHVLATKKPDV